MMAAGRPVGHHLAAVEHDDAVAQPLRLLDVVGDEHHGRAGVADPPDHLPGVPPADGVEVLGELVEEHELRPADESQRDEQPLALAAGQGGERAAPQVRRAATPSASSSSGCGLGWSDANRSQRLADPQPVGEGGVLELGCRCAGGAGRRRSAGRAPAPRPCRCRRGAGPAGSRRWSSCRRRWCRGGRRARRGARRTRCRAAPRWRRSSGGARGRRRAWSTGDGWAGGAVRVVWWAWR